MKFLYASLVACLCYLPSYAFTQSLEATPLSDSVVPKLSEHVLNILNSRYSTLNKLVEQRTRKILHRMEKKELALQQRLHGSDSLKSIASYMAARAKYQQLSASLTSGLPNSANPLHEYIPGVDSMQTALRFLNELGRPGEGGVQELADLQKIQTAGSQLQQLQGTLQNANNVQAFVREREQQLKDQLVNAPVARQLLGINKEAYYYQAQLSQYKALLNDPDKMQQAVLSAVRQMPYFQHYWQQNSYFSRLFPASAAKVVSTDQQLGGLQTRDKVQQEVQQRLGISSTAATSKAIGQTANGGGGSGLAYLQHQMQSMNSQLQQIKDNLAKFSSTGWTGNGNMTMPDFQPNSQHNKTFLQRLQLSAMIQNNPSTPILPAISNLGLNLGYKLSDKLTVGVGASYLLGLGYPIKDIRVSNQGIGLRTFADIKAKGSVWISGGFEYNYLQQFASIRNISHLDVWQKSALIGLTKKYKINRKENNLQLLYDLLAASEVPKGQPFVFRLSWGF
jgi:hypothetical protein